MKTEKVTATIATALAEIALSKIREAREEQSEKIKANALNSPEVKAMCKIRKEQKRLERQFSELHSKAEKKYGLTINVYTDSSTNAFQRRETLPSIATLKNEIIIANHMDGVDSKSVVGFIVKQYTKQ